MHDGEKGKRWKSLFPLPIVLRELIFSFLQPSCDTNKPLSGKKFSNMYVKINRSVKTP